jgi:hypothetical protein
MVRALYQGPGDLLIPSNIHRIRVGTPLSREEDCLAQDFFSYEVGMSLYLRGSQSPHLAKGVGLLEEVADQYSETMRGARVAHRIAPGIARPFFRLQGDGGPEARAVAAHTGRPAEQTMEQVYEGDPERALEMTERVLDVYRGEKTKAMNIPYACLVQMRSDMLSSLGRNDEARDELATLETDLSERGVNKSVLSEITNRIESIEPGAASRAPGRRTARGRKGPAKKSRAKKPRG